MRHYRPSLRILFPYCFKLDKTGHILYAYNRDYKYIPRAIFRFARKPSTFNGIWHIKYSDVLYMYNDDSYSRTDYFERLAKLFSHKHDMIQDKITPNVYTIKAKDIQGCHYLEEDEDHVGYSTHRSRG